MDCKVIYILIHRKIRKEEEAFTKPTTVHITKHMVCRRMVRGIPYHISIVSRTVLILSVPSHIVLNHMPTL